MGPEEGQTSSGAAPVPCRLVTREVWALVLLLLTPQKPPLHPQRCQLRRVWDTEHCPSSRGSKSSTKINQHSLVAANDPAVRLPAGQGRPERSVPLRVTDTALRRRGTAARRLPTPAARTGAPGSRAAPAGLLAQAVHGRQVGAQHAGPAVSRAACLVSAASGETGSLRSQGQWPRCTPRAPPPRSPSSLGASLFGPHQGDWDSGLCW